MNPIYILLILVSLLLSYWLFKKVRHQRRRAMLIARPLTLKWQDFLKENVVIYNYLPNDLQLKLQGFIQVFMDEKRFEGCGGLEVTEEMKVTVAAQASLLLLNLKHNYYPKLCSILIYPSAYTSTERQLINGVVIEAPSTRLGESWMNGTLILAWDCVQREAKDINEANNVIIHEFTHQLDQEDGLGDGVPILSGEMDYADWQVVFSSEFSQFLKKISHHQHDIIDPYGSTNPAEFFAVVTEVFFKKPRQLHQEHPKLYQALKSYYQLNPIAWGY